MNAQYLTNGYPLKDVQTLFWVYYLSATFKEPYSDSFLQTQNWCKFVWRTSLETISMIWEHTCHCMQWTSYPFHNLKTEMSMAIQKTRPQPQPHKSSKTFLWPTENWNTHSLVRATPKMTVKKMFVGTRLLLLPTTLSLFVCTLLMQESTLAELNQHVSGLVLLSSFFCLNFWANKHITFFWERIVSINILANMVDMIRFTRLRVWIPPSWVFQSFILQVKTNWAIPV